jgi:hypothetical protein
MAAGSVFGTHRPSRYLVSHRLFTLILGQPPRGDQKHKPCKEDCVLQPKDQSMLMRLPIPVPGLEGPTRVITLSISL